MKCYSVIIWYQLRQLRSYTELHVFLNGISNLGLKHNIENYEDNVNRNSLNTNHCIN